MPSIDLAKGSYRLRVASSPEDLDAVFRLRFQVFNLELGEGLERSFATGRDQDEFDAHCHHLMVEYGPEHDIIGTYRLQTAERARAGAGFYSANEFHLEDFPDDLVDASVELGRACIDSRHRNRSVLLMLWKGLRCYIEHFGKRYFFGCNSLTSQDPELAWATYAWLKEKGHVRPDFNIRPLADWACPRPAMSAAELGQVRVPPLFAAYLRYGSKVCSEPAIDREFKTIDYLTVFDLTTIQEEELARFR